MALICDLPTEIIFLIIGHLEFACNVNSLGRTSRFWSTLCNKWLYDKMYLDLTSGFTYDKHCLRDFALQKAAETGNISCLRKILTLADPSFNTKRASAALVIAASNNDIEIARALLGHGINANLSIEMDLPDEEANYLQGGSPLQSPLSIATIRGYDSMAKLLLDHGVESDTSNPDFRLLRPILVAIQFHRVSIAKLLIDHGCDPFVTDDEDDSDIRAHPLELAAKYDSEILQLFLHMKSAPDVNEYQSLYEGLLSAATLYGNVSAAQTFLDCGVGFDHEINPHTTDVDPITVFMLDDSSGTNIFSLLSRTAGLYPDVNKLLLRQISVETALQGQDSQIFFYMLMTAAKGGYLDMMSTLLKMEVSSLVPPYSDEWLGECLSIALLETCKFGHFAVAELILDKLEKRDLDLRRSWLALERAAYEGDIAIFKLIFDKWADSEPLFAVKLLMAAVSGERAKTDDTIQIIQEMIDRKAFEDCSTMAIDLILPHAASRGDRMFEYIRQQFQLEADPENEEHQSEFWKSVARLQPGIVEFFLQRGFGPNSSKVQIDVPLGYLENLLAIAGEEGSANHEENYETVIDLLLQFGADIEWICPFTGNTALLFHANRFGISPELMPGSAKCAKALLKRGANPKAVCPQGETSLVKAAKKGDIAMVKTFLEHFDEEGIPFHQTKSMVEDAEAVAEKGLKVGDRTSEGHAGVIRAIHVWYWPKVYPCAKGQ